MVDRQPVEKEEAGAFITYEGGVQTIQIRRIGRVPLHYWVQFQIQSVQQRTAVHHR